MKVLYVHHGVVLGGSPVSLSLLVDNVDAHNVKPIISSHSSNMRSLFKERTDAEVMSWPDPLTILGKILIGWASIWNLRTLAAGGLAILKAPSSIRRQMSLLEDIKPSIVHLNSAVLITTAIAAYRVGIPVVWHIREVLIPGNCGLERLYRRIIRKMSDRIICISEAEARSLGSETSAIHVVYNPVDFEMLDPREYDRSEERRKLKIDVEDDVVLSLGGVSPRKGTAEIVRASEELSQDTTVIFAGPALEEDVDPSKGQLLRWIEDRLVECGLKDTWTWYYRERVAESLVQVDPDNIRFVGLVSNVGPLIAACDVLVFAGTTPHFPRPVYEAWAMKTPVIVFSMEGVSRNVSHGRDGLVVDEKSGEALGRSLSDMLERMNLCQMGRRGYTKAVERTDPDRGARRVFEIYQEIV